MQQLEKQQDIDDAWKIKNEVGENIAQIAQIHSKGIVDKLSEIENPLPPSSETKLKGNNPFHRILVGDYRIIYEIQNVFLVILVIKIGYRKNIYKHLS